MKRIFLIVLDSVGAGELPDAALFGDKGANTLKSVSTSKKLNIPRLRDLGIANILGVEFLNQCHSPIGAHGKLAEASMGKDTTIGHWEIAGVISPDPLPTYPNGFPQEIIDAFSNATGRGVLCNKPYSGTEVIKDYGRQHIKTGDLIVYTSADSVFQIAAHEDVVPAETLYDYCKKARAILTGKNAVGRVIARPFIGTYPNYTRTERRRDFSVEPPHDTILDILSRNGFDTIAVGKITDIFAGRGITQSLEAHDNYQSMDATMRAAQMDFTGLCFANFVDFDMKYGHRRDIDGYANALTEFDNWLNDFLPVLSEDDMLIITADHGCDPGFTGSDHTREYVPLLVYGKDILPVNLGIGSTYADIAVTIADILGVEYDGCGTSFAGKILK